MLLQADWFCYVTVMKSCRMFSSMIREFLDRQSTECFSLVPAISGCQCQPCGLWMWRDVQWFSALGLFCGTGCPCVTVCYLCWNSQLVVSVCVSSCSREWCVWVLYGVQSDSVQDICCPMNEVSQCLSYICFGSCWCVFGCIRMFLWWKWVFVEFLWFWLGRGLTSCEHTNAYMRRPCKGHEMGCLQLLLLKPKTGD